VFRRLTGIISPFLRPADQLVRAETDRTLTCSRRALERHIEHRHPEDPDRAAPSMPAETAVPTAAIAAPDETRGAGLPFTRH